MTLMALDEAMQDGTAVTFWRNDLEAVTHCRCVKELRKSYENGKPVFTAVLLDWNGKTTYCVSPAWVQRFEK